MAVLRTLLAAGAVLALFWPGTALALTNPDQFQKLVAFRDAMLARPGQQNWSKALASWTCPTPPDNSVGAACDPCGQRVWGNWDHAACRGAPMGYATDAVPGTGVVTNVHITDYRLEGEVPLAELCPLSSLREFDLDGSAFTGPIPGGFADCFPALREIDLSYGQLSGTVPPEIARNKLLRQFKVEVNRLTGQIPPELGSLPSISWLRFAKNRMSGPVPSELAATAPKLSQLGLDTNDFEGDLYALAQHRLVSFSAHANERLCGMVPVGVRYAHGFNFHATGLGMPCPEELAGGLE